MFCIYYIVLSFEGLYTFVYAKVITSKTTIQYSSTGVTYWIAFDFKIQM